jgi:hypothetical protein
VAVTLVILLMMLDMSIIVTVRFWYSATHASITD